MASIREELPPPVVAADRNIAELTVKALILGALLSMILAAANAYIGLLVGLTVSASIPAAAASMGILRLFRRSTILENNMVQTAASAGDEAVCPQLIFPFDGAVLRFAERNGVVRSAWTGAPNTTYIIEYDVGEGVHSLSGSFAVFGDKRDFGPYSRDLWASLAVRNPWRARVSPDTQPRCWSEWVEFTFE